MESVVALVSNTRPLSNPFRGGGRSRGGRGGKIGNRKDDRFCKHCQTPGHTEEKCWLKYGRREWAKQPSNSSQCSCHVKCTCSTVTLTHEDFEQLLKMAQGETVGPSASFANVGISANNSYSIHSWHVDSGASPI